jgi:hypothetical protein
MKLNFIIDKNYLIKHTLYCVENNRFSSDKNKKDILSFSNYVFKKSPKYYDFLVGVISPNDISEKNLKLFIKEIDNDLPKFLYKIKQSKEFKKIFNQTEKYLQLSKKQWERNLKKTGQIIEDLTKLKLDKNFTVYITHPSQRNGSNWGNNIVSWGVDEKWKNYATVYLWHEILHSYFDKSDVSHAIIELIADEELRKRLNNSNYPPFEGHKNLNELKNNILPYWKKYLKLEIKDITKFQKRS